MTSFHEKLILDRIGIARSLSRIAHEIIEKNKGTGDLVLVGIRTCGVHLANRLRKKIVEIEKVEVPIGVLDITLYRDDLMTKKEHPVLKTTDIPHDITKKKVILVDDVITTGATLNECAQVLLDAGAKAVFAVTLAVVVE